MVLPLLLDTAVQASRWQGLPTFPEIRFKEGQQLIICGVVTCAIKRFVG